ALPTSFSVETLPGAPEGVRGLVEKCGGLRATQLVFWGGADDAPGPFGLWWPWGDGTTVSLRIGLHDVDIPKERYPRLRDGFAIPQAPGGEDAICLLVRCVRDLVRACRGSRRGH